MSLYLDAFRSAATSLHPWLSRAYWLGSHTANSHLSAQDQIPHSLFRSFDTGRHRRDMELRRAEMRLPDPIAVDDWPLVSICIVLFNSSSLLSTLFKSLNAVDYPKERLELIMVDNGSSDESWGIADTLCQNLGDWHLVKCIRQDNLGYGGGQNVAVEASRGAFILLLNPDAYMQPGSLTCAVNRALADRDDVAAWEFVQSPSPHPKYFDAVTWETSWNAHAATLMRRNAFIMVGGYDPALFLYGEDVDLSYRLRRAGWRLRVLPDVMVRHDTQMTRPMQRHSVMLANRLLRRRFGGWIARLQGRALFVRIRALSKDAEECSAVLLAESIYRESKQAFRPLSKAKVHYPFDGVHFERRRTGMTSHYEAGRTNEQLIDNTPLVSIVTRTHGDYPHLRDCLSCVRQQTYPAIEHILVEDNACENSPAQRLAKQLGRIIYVPMPHVGRSRAGNAGADAASGQYLIWLDQDDLIYPDHVARLVEAMQVNPDAAAAYSLSWEAMIVERPGFRQTRRLMGPIGLETKVTTETLAEANRVPVQSVMFRRALFEQLGGFDPTIDLHEDWDLWRRYAEAGRFICVPALTSIFGTPGRLLDRFRRQLALRRA